MQAFLITIVTATLLQQEAKTLDLKERPVSKVINLLKEMQGQLEKEKAADEELQGKMDCWCENNEKAKTEAVGTANQRIDSFHADIQKAAAKSAGLKAEIAQAEKNLAASEQALDTATELRSSEQEEFNQSEKDLVQSIGALKNAVLVLSRHHEAFLQTGKDKLYSLLKKVTQSVAPIHRKRVKAGLVQRGPANAGSYAPASGQILGILKQMQEEFEKNLSTSQADEAQSQADFVSLRTAKRAEIAATKNQIKEQTQQLADSDEALATGKEDLQLTREALATDSQFLEDLKLRCQQSGHDWDLRSKTRADEIAAVSMTIKMLTDDDAHDLFANTMNFIQLRTTESSKKRAEASNVLSKVAKKTGSLALQALSASVKLDGFEKVKAAIDELVGALKKEQADEVQHRDFCTDEFNQNDKQTAVKNREIKELTALIDNSAATIKTLAGEIDQLHKDIAEMEVQMKKAGEEREGENHEFQQAVTDQRATQEILTKALARLKEFYEKKAPAAFVQQPDASEPGAAVAAAPQAHAEYKKNAGAGGVMSLIQNIIDEAHTMEKDALQAEGDSQSAYEEFIKNSNGSISNANKSIVAKTDEKAQTESTKVAAEGDRTGAMTDAEELAAYNGELHKSCDFLMKNFDLRQDSRNQEMEALAQAKAILSGADI